MSEQLTNLPLSPPLQEVLVEVRTALQRLYGERLLRLIVFGSYARSEAHAESDLDILVVLNDPVDALEEARRTSKVVVDVALHHGVGLSILHLSEADFEQSNRPLLQNVSREGIELT